MPFFVKITHTTPMGIFIEQTTKTPSIKADSSGIIELKGISVPEDGIKFFLPLKNWIDTYSKSPAPLTLCKVNLDYFNTSSAKVLLNIFRLLEKIGKDGHEVKVVWSYEENDSEIEEAGHDFANLIDIAFEFNELKA